MRIWTIFCLIMFVTISSFLTGQYISIPKEVVVPIRNEIEQAIKKKLADNVIEIGEQIGLECGSGFRIRAPQMICKSVEQFVNLVPKKERVFVSLKPRVDNRILKKIYLLDGAGEIIYQDEYFYSEKEFIYKVKDYDWQKVIFRKQAEELLVIITAVGIATGVLWLLGVMTIAGRRMYNKTITVK